MKIVSKLKRALRSGAGVLEWKFAARQSLPTPALRPVRRLLVLPSDATSIIGAKGDEAMITAVVARLQTLQPDMVVGVVTTTAQASAIVAGMGYVPVECSHRLLQFIPIANAAKAFDADLLVALGADVMDGYYSPQASMRLLAGADLVARQQCPAVLLGFSFNSAPSAVLKPVFDGASPNLRINVRDPISFGRFSNFSSARARLVADSAFMLQPATDNPVFARVKQWAVQERAVGRRVFAFNIHPMLIKNASATEVQGLITAATAALDKVLASLDVSILFLSHDYRGSSGDDVCLAPIHAALQAKWRDRINYPTEQLSAAQLKGLAGAADAVVTGRMHLAIAALGCGVPVGAFSYQDKFNGLYRHFDLSEDLILTPAALSEQSIYQLIERIHANCDALTAAVQQRLPVVRKMSALNLDEFVSSAVA